MIGVEGIGGVPDPKSDRTSGVSGRRDANAPADSEGRKGDGVVISSEAQAAARLTEILAATANQPDIRQERVDAARQAIERGDYRDPEIVSQVASRIERLL